MGDREFRQISDKSMFPVVDTIHDDDDYDYEYDDTPLSTCSVCRAFIVDWLRLPVAKEDPFYPHMKWPIIWKAADQLADIFLRILSTLETNQKIALKFIFSKKNVEYTNMNRHLMILYYMNKDDIDYLVSVLEDLGSLRANREWIGYALKSLFFVLEEIHDEHTFMKPNRNTGPCLGLRSFSAAAAASNTNSPVAHSGRTCVPVQESSSCSPICRPWSLPKV